jgi:hypothetical protein
VGAITPRPGVGPTGKQNLQQVEQLPADALIAGDSDANRSWVNLQVSANHGQFGSCEASHSPFLCWDREAWNLPDGKTQGWVLTPPCDRRPEAYRRQMDRKEAAQTRYSDSGEEAPSRPHPKPDPPDWAGTANAVISVSAGHGRFVGLAGLEPAASSLSEIDSQAPCSRASAQVASIREGRRDGVNCGSAVAASRDWPGAWVRGESAPRSAPALW